MQSKWIGQEDRLHRMVLDYIRLAHPQWIVVHPANEGKRSRYEVYKAKLLGLERGISDLFIHAPHGRTLVLELKAKGKKPTSEQYAFLVAMGKIGFSATWCDNFDAAKNIIDAWGKRDI